ncbi:hypothetical protein PR002_g16838 [Phytophthora rubi]|uniref:Uncharacterized protein n=1 Tax=Phytophthora rubi TaxID=129364 RepID=A0A6A3KDS0_9STRA|nr:hypothetical protein PR002_g16838 [Phytophthora rubi]
MACSSRSSSASPPLSLVACLPSAACRAAGRLQNEPKQNAAICSLQSLTTES